ncbi:hypothetical protein PR003_g24827 [Phytophthora rubi]|uniref:RxLR effector protein n=1 Tax=Phytophthora rubi TaxID=129364 RepID=A0A6A3IJM7_9STRA|nr:hypothetical protein PR002_g24022 [Phytophthora rubi]KAE8982779.1 hypothetical protein PR001_g23625 [Phytophthora rubi]KAE9292156.1 hypothetical protein PR003_g24827 [Phytophthora rubi]
MLSLFVSLALFSLHVRPSTCTLRGSLDPPSQILRGPASRAPRAGLLRLRTSQPLASVGHFMSFCVICRPSFCCVVRVKLR